MVFWTKRESSIGIFKYYTIIVHCANSLEQLNCNITCIASCHMHNLRHANACGLDNKGEPQANIQLWFSAHTKVFVCMCYYRRHTWFISKACKTTHTPIWFLILSHTWLCGPKWPKKTTWIRGEIKSLPFSFLTHLTNLLITLQQTHAYIRHGITWYVERYFTWLHVGTGLTSGVHLNSFVLSFLLTLSLSLSFSQFLQRGKLWNSLMTLTVFPVYKTKHTLILFII